MHDWETSGPAAQGIDERLLIPLMQRSKIEEFGSSFGPNAEKIMADILNFTHTEPFIQSSEAKI